MCLAVPCRIVAIDGLAATVEAYGKQRDVNLMLIDGEAALGDYVLVQASGLAFERVDPDRAEATLAVIDQIAAVGVADVLAW
jgi:hydrogenase expression/formation protein HypC